MAESLNPGTTRQPPSSTRDAGLAASMFERLATSISPSALRASTRARLRATLLLRTRGAKSAKQEHPA